MHTIYFTDNDMIALVKILDNALSNPDLFTDINEDGYEEFNRDFFKQIDNLKKLLKNSIDIT